MSNSSSRIKRFESFKDKSIKVKQIKSVSGRENSQRKTIVGLGLGTVGSISDLKVTGEIIGMLNKVQHLIEVVE
jgi:large subunit ribosomal protein L30